MENNAENNAAVQLEDEIQQKLAEITPEQALEQMGKFQKLAEEIKNDLGKAFERVAAEYETEENRVQYGIRFRDLPEGQGQPYFSVMVDWKEQRLGNFNRDILGIEGKAALYPDDSGKETIVNGYLLGFEPLKVEGIFVALCKKYQVTQWSRFSGIFYKLKNEDPIKLGIFIQYGATIKKVETVDVFADLAKLSLGGVAEGAEKIEENQNQE